MRQHSTAWRDKAAVSAARAYLLGFSPVSPRILDLHLKPTLIRTLPGLYMRLLESAQNYQMAPKVIGGRIGGVPQLSEVLYGFRPAVVARRYADSADVLRAIRARLLRGQKVRTGKRAIWTRFAKSIISGARFLAEFRSGDEFHAWVRARSRTEGARLRLLDDVRERVDGMGHALAADFLKESGHLQFGKPDVHLKTILHGLGLAEARDDTEILRAVGRIARSCHLTPYKVDKLFWLVGSGLFYKVGIRIPTDRARFILDAKRLLGRTSANTRPIGDA